MRHHDRLLILGGFLMSAMIAVGCSGSSSNGGAGGTGFGGSTGVGGKGGAAGGAMDAGTDHGSTADTGTDTSGTGGKIVDTADAHPDVATDKGTTDTGTGDTATDMAVDTAVDTAPDASGPCVTNYGAGNPVQFAFNGGVNQGWYTFATHNSDTTGLTTSLGASYTEGRMCAGALLLALNPTVYGQSGAIETYFGTSPNGRNWTGYKALHAWIKAESANLSELNGVYFYMKSGNAVFYQNAFVAGANLSDWYEAVIDLTRAPSNGNGVVINDVQQIGFEVSLNAGAGTGPATPSQLFLLADDIWLEAAPPSDAGTDTGSATDAGGQ